MPRKSNTRSAQGSGTIRQRADGRWEARYTVGRDPGTGKQIQKSVYGSTQREVSEKLRKITASIDDRSYQEPCKMRLKEWLDIWTSEYLGDVKPSTAHLYTEQVRLYITPALGAVRLDELNTHNIQIVYNRLKRGQGGKPGLSPKTIRNIHGVLHKALQQAVDCDYLKVNPANSCKLPKATQKEIQPLDEVQMQDFLNAIKGHRHEILYKVDLFTGLREGEILGLTWDCINFDKGTITIKQQLRREQKKGGQYYLSDPKNGKPRTIAPAPSVMKLLRIQRTRQLEQRLRVGELWQNTNMVFTNETGGYLSYRTVYDCFKRIVDKIGVPNIRFHDLRHTYAVNAIRAGDDFKTLQENLGHATAAFTMQVYGHVTEQMKKDSSDRMEQFMKGISGL